LEKLANRQLYVMPRLLRPVHMQAEFITKKVVFWGDTMYGNTSQKMAFLTVTAKKTSNLK
jgi:hypothetical protein